MNENITYTNDGNPSILASMVKKTAPSSSAAAAAAAAAKSKNSAAAKPKATKARSKGKITSSSKPRTPAGDPAHPEKNSSRGPEQEDDDDDDGVKEAAAAAAEEEEQQRKAQQALLDVFGAALSLGPGQEGKFAARLQTIKQALYQRDFAAAFGREDLLEAYAARWSPTRALCYARVLRGVGGYLEALVDAGGDGGSTGTAATTAMSAAGGESSADEELKGDDEQQQKQRQRTLRMLAIGGGAAEIVAFGAYLASTPTSTATIATPSTPTSPSPSSPSSPPSPPHPQPPPLNGSLHLLDTGPWGPIITALHARLTTPPPLSKYASAAARAANAALVAPASRLAASFAQRDVLALSEADLSGLLLFHDQQQQPVLVTLLFTLNELYTAAGVGPTTAFLRRLSSVVCPGSLLLVVDSPGSYSEAAVGGGGGSSSAGEQGQKQQQQQQQQQQPKEKRRYPMQWLLDHTLLHQQQEEEREQGRRRRQQKQEQEQERKQGLGQEKGEGRVITASEENGEEAEGAAGARIGAAGEEEVTTKATMAMVGWEKLESADSVWFRLADGLRYPIPLEDMRYQMHLYRALPYPS
ncbi:hypothetical protein SLS62_007170 [Diatrype stigma]|uniref:25S rRNA (Uridine(2843)-N(3))-methyltransferase n=1 Tax=Diatrype stigma TaxID=117547 RepID=A0AAN9UPH4_9PEZI